MNLLPQNQAVVAQRFPVTLQRMAAAQTEFPNFEFQKNGSQSLLKMVRDGKEVYPYGIKNPSKLVDHWMESISIQESMLYALTGFGDGLHIRRFLKKLSDEETLFVAEADARLLWEVFSREDYTDILKDERFFLSTGEMDEPFFHPLQEVAVYGVKNLIPLVYSPLHSIHEGYYEKFQTELIRKYLFLRPLYMANLDTAVVNQQNTLDNISLLADAPDIQVVENEFSDLPLILVGAGPSLDESIEFLKEAQHKAIIACSNSPYRKLINNGIIPHLTVSADPKEGTGAGYDNLPLDDVFLAAPMSATPSIHKKFVGKTFSWSGISPIANSLRMRLSIGPGTAIVEQGTVSACILDIARFIGCKKVCFVGQDMAMTESGKYYTSDSVYGDTGNAMDDPNTAQRLPGNTQKSVPVESRLFVYLKTFEQFIEKYSDIEYVNTARLGAKVEGAEYMDYEQAQEWLGNADASTVRDRLSKHLPDSIDTDVAQQKARDVMEPTYTYIKTVFEKALEAALRIEMLPEKFANTNYANHSRVKECIKDADIVNSIVDSNNEDYEILFEGQTKRELVNYRKRIRTIKHTNRAWEVLQHNKEYYWALVEGTNNTLQMLEEKLNFSKN